MDKFSIEGPSRIKGKVKISGSKNSSIPILAATLLFNQPVVIKNLPKVRDINTMIRLLKSLGSKVILSKDRRTAKIYNKKKNKNFCKLFTCQNNERFNFSFRTFSCKIFQIKDIFAWRMFNWCKTSQLSFGCFKKTWDELYFKRRIYFCKI